MRTRNNFLVLSLLLLLVFGSTAHAASPGDVNRDGVYDFEDLLILSTNYDQWMDEYLNGEREISPFVQFSDLSANFGDEVAP